MMGILCCVIGRTAMAKVGMLNQTNIFKRLKVSIDRREINSWMALSNALCHFLRGGMA
jgi:hypothetical protein